MQNHFNPDLRLDESERALLAQMAAMPGYKVLHRLCRSEVDKFIIKLVNCEAYKPEEVHAAHLLAKAAAQFYEGITNSINEEILQYTAAPRKGDTPVDLTEGVLDLEAYAQYERAFGGRNIWEDE